MMDRIVDEGIKGDLMVDGKRYGLVLDVGGYYKNVITLAPSLNITREEVDLAMRLLDEILRPRDEKLTFAGRGKPRPRRQGFSLLCRALNDSALSSRGGASAFCWCTALPGRPPK